MIEIKTANELQTLMDNGGCVFVKFGASWCAPCRALTANINAIENEYQNITFISIDVDEAEESIIEKYGVMQVPQVIIFKNGNKVDEFIGSLSRKQLTDKLDNYA